MRRLALAVELVAILAIFWSFFAGESRYGAFSTGVVLFVAAALVGWRGNRRAMPAFWLWFASLAVYAFLYIPLAIVIIFSFNDSKLNAEWVGFTLEWYRRLAADASMLRAAFNSLSIALVASGVATALGTMAGIAMHRFR